VFLVPESRNHFPMPMDSSNYDNKHRVVDELRCLKILRTPYSLDSPDISPCDFWTFGDLKGKLKEHYLQTSEEILRGFQELWDNTTFEEFQMIFESRRDWWR
jgi:hypothetical protein